ncbi:MAG: molecular chaperone HtpG [Ruminococcaceae bacterium]|nr:molecular chaperone HtpG [Oscillospiraceae bacterium]
MIKKQFQTESKRILDIMVNSIYTNREIFLRELISNASDAIDKLCYISLTDDKVSLSREDYRITVTPDKTARTITISDNGVGMTEEELENNLGVIAKSGSLQFKQDMAEKGDDTSDIIGQFGVGFYSAFMIAQRVTVITKAYGESMGRRWVSSGAEGYTIEEWDKDSFGTNIILDLKPDSENEDYSEFLDDWKLRSLIKKYSDYIRWPIVMGEETVNSMVPIWQRPKDEAPDEDCFKFYKENFFDSTDPVSVIRINAEGMVSYKAMLFIPGAVPYDYYTTGYEPGLKLYASGVMIMDKCADLIPEYFRFVRGVVDSPDLSLNISRELLQQTRQLKVIASNIEKKIKAELKNLLNKEPEKYLSFFKSFGLQLKYGVVNNYGAKKELLQDLLLFYSAREEKLISLAEYVKNMAEGQEFIYFACADSVAVAKGLPQTEPVRNKGYDILYMTDSIDEFVVNMLSEYMEKKFKSVFDDDLGFEVESKSEDTDENNQPLLDFVKETLGDKIHCAKISTKLVSYPVCLGTEGPVTLEMEKYFNSIPHEDGQEIKAQRVLELNSGHPVFSALKNAFENDRERAENYCHILSDLALLLAGLPVDDPSEFSSNVWNLMK